MKKIWSITFVLVTLVISNFALFLPQKAWADSYVPPTIGITPTPQLNGGTLTLSGSAGAGRYVSDPQSFECLANDVVYDETYSSNSSISQATWSISGGGSGNFTPSLILTRAGSDSNVTCNAMHRPVITSLIQTLYSYNLSLPAPVTQGTHTLTLTVTDAFGNVGTATYTYTVAPPPATTGSLTVTINSIANATSCIIPINASHCSNVNLSWSTLNPHAGVTSDVTSIVDNSGNSNIGFHVSSPDTNNANPGTQPNVTVYESRTFYLYNTELLDQKTVTAGCDTTVSTWVGGICAPVVNVSATTPYNTTPSTNVSFASTSNTTSGAGTECELLDNTQAPLTSYLSTNPIVYPAASATGAYAYYVKCRDKTTTTATAISNQIIVNVISVPPPPTAATPTFSPIAGSYTSPQTVTISSTTSGATFCYTIDGSTPTGNGSGSCVHGTAGSSVAVSSNETLKAIATKSGYTDSAVGSAAYTINNIATSTTNCGPSIANPVHYQCNPGNPILSSEKSLTSEWTWTCQSIDRSTTSPTCHQPKTAPRPIEN